MHYLDSYPGIVFMSDIRQFLPSGNQLIVSERCLARHGALQAGSASFDNNQPYPTSSPRLIVIKRPLTNSAAFFGIVGSHRWHDYAILQLHPAYARWLKNFLESSCNHRWLLLYLKTVFHFSPKFTTKPESTIHLWSQSDFAQYYISFKAQAGDLSKSAGR
jgi:hypothetical protein